MNVKSIGKCENCKKDFEKKEMTKHIIECTTTAKSKKNNEKVIQLFIEAYGMPEYWLYIEGNDKATFKQLDSFLRNIWLECCGHMSAFYDQKIEISKQSIFRDYFYKVNIKFNYDYDFGSTTSLSGKSINSRMSITGNKSIKLLARNKPLNLTCSKCDKTAEVVCPFCIDEEPYLFCSKHSKEHKCSGEEVYLPVVNSPRMGVCGYTGN